MSVAFWYPVTLSTQKEKHADRNPQHIMTNLSCIVEILNPLTAKWWCDIVVSGRVCGQDAKAAFPAARWTSKGRPSTRYRYALLLDNDPHTPGEGWVSHPSPCQRPRGCWTKLLSVYNLCKQYFLRFSG